MGYAWFPFSFSDEDSPAHGVVIIKSTLPFNNDNVSGLGHTLTHEVGHYLGLFHTFQGDCADLDGCADTPAHYLNRGTPPPETDTCKDQPGFDPVHNFMNYVNDEWMQEFTADQRTLAAAVSTMLRPNLFRNYIWGDYEWQSGNWRNVTWFDWIRDYDYPWIWSNSHGWQWTSPDCDSVDYLWLWDSELGWIWTTQSDYPWIFSENQNTWLWFQLNSNPREFYNSSTGLFVSFFVSSRS